MRGGPGGGLVRQNGDLASGFRHLARWPEQLASSLEGLATGAALLAPSLERPASRWERLPGWGKKLPRSRARLTRSSPHLTSFERNQHRLWYSPRTQGGGRRWDIDWEIERRA